MTAQGRVRAGALARSAGISVQQLRNYVEAGVLPPVERTPAGYRVFTRAHADALVAVRELAAGHGWPTARAVMRAVHVGDLESALAAIDAGHAELTRERAQLATVREALAGWPATPDGPRSPLRIGEAARAVGVRPPVLRLWESRGLLRPVREPGTGYRLYDRAELRTAHIVALLRRGHQPLAAIGTVLEALCSTGSPDDVLGELAARERELHDRSLGRLRASAALHAYLTVAGGMVVVAGSGAGAS